jgi:MPBQ/MSBQ methyltransferase
MPGLFDHPADNLILENAPIMQIFFLVLLLALVTGGIYLRSRLRVPVRHYEGPKSVSNVYDTWTNDRILETYWGEHLHAGYYGNPPVKKDFVAAKVDFIDEMIRWGISTPAPGIMERLESYGNTFAEPVRILDAGCGIGGTTRHMAKRWPKTAHITGITISKAQVERATLLARTQCVENALFLECDALNTGFPDASFDVVWAVESEMHMPDKNDFIREMVRVLKPDGMLVIAAWNVRDTHTTPLSKAEAAHIRLLVDEWAHASFTSIPDYIEILKKNHLQNIAAEDWAVPTQPSWRHAVQVAMRNPRRLINISMKQRWSLVRDAYTILRYDEAFRKGLCEYGLIRGQKVD